MEIRISVAKDFSETPGARYKSDGSFSGQEFYEQILNSKFAQALAENEILIIDLDGTEGYATSFLDEAFRRLGEDFGQEIVWKNISIISNDEPDWIDEIRSYIYQS
ncbi:STAS-like domain-containing protein [Sphingobacterium sp. UDSM-2020]|uniref:STAS-like domain-containing protein n=1 Tax=Sphingobacterium sp. UDSM-2020 TaxID=2795738 RepID=UPI0019360467|nr:STAS-like domain-containing protein [Sphingobacterium sp. UDSM-2020]QQD14268.1 STAS-like domain-containing protein [Sphingobacterium sp. UDSM-2020]